MRLYMGSIWGLHRVPLKGRYGSYVGLGFRA